MLSAQEDILQIHILGKYPIVLGILSFTEITALLASLRLYLRLIVHIESPRHKLLTKSGNRSGSSHMQPPYLCGTKGVR